MTETTNDQAPHTRQFAQICHNPAKIRGQLCPAGPVGRCVALRRCQNQGASTHRHPFVVAPSEPARPG
jgi:hypothetical protein